MKRLSILLSGSGTTCEAILTAIKNKKLAGIEVCVVISSRSDAGGIEKAQQFQAPVETVERKKYTTQTEFGVALLEVLQKYEIDIVSQNGWLPLTPKSIIDAYQNRIINQHPGPLDPGRPDFGGKDMFGARVVAARIIYSWVVQDDFWTESTIHHVSYEFDKGELIRTTSTDIPVPSTKMSLEDLKKNHQLIFDATKKVQQKLLAIEHENVISTLQAYADGHVPTYIRTQPLIPAHLKHILDQAKELAISLFPHG